MSTDRKLKFLKSENSIDYPTPGARIKKKKNMLVPPSAIFYETQHK